MIWSGLSKAGDGTVDQRRVLCVYDLISEAKPLHRSGAEIFDEHIGCGDQTPQEFLPYQRANIQCHAILVTIHRDKSRRFSVVVRRSHTSRIITPARILNLDNLRPQICQQHPTKRTSHDLSKL